jgi:hypothetical protein
MSRRSGDFWDKLLVEVYAALSLLGLTGYVVAALAF